MDTDQQAGAGSSAALAALSAARANHENARANYDRLTALYEAGAVSVQDLDAVRTGLEAAGAQLAQAQAGYTQARALRDNAWIAAPFSGRVGRVWARAGNSASGASPWWPSAETAACWQEYSFPKGTSTAWPLDSRPTLP